MHQNTEQPNASSRRQDTRGSKSGEELNTLHVRTGLRAGESVPLGDAVAWLTHATGLDRLAQKYTELTGQDCGCDERREWLNQLIKY